MPLTFFLTASLLALSAGPVSAETPPAPAIPVVQTRDGLPHVFAKLRAHRPVTELRPPQASPLQGQWIGGLLAALRYKSL